MSETGSYEAHARSPIVFAANCPSRPILDQIADKWSMMVMAVLEKPTRFNEIKRRLDGVTQRVLTQTLRRLERNGMIERRVLPTSPVGVEYSLTSLGKSLQAPFGQLYDWTVDHSAEIRAAQANYDDGANAASLEGGSGKAKTPTAHTRNRGFAV
ncbi:winged helix-turn-helix transcriptional regulator [Arthrobacter russicus]|uniref:DNA-binding HxlR family transcriptional regulator n=1 Tax=Arthrobacter russicus TaxID=172040 RepID=A0ABU1JEL7_9MICC|nr:helix-turn-helix domain-containing protein [Arthrobacter russicus]MDN5669378.1 helix-turn-helix transcriptional regulator [Renibacterium salmoninarum]MDR6269856.1 DNA-binding HxlR family transcriptional regulator [Arthrobacter russicus]